MRLAAFVLGNSVYDDENEFATIDYCRADACDLFKILTEQPTGLFDPKLSLRVINANIEKARAEIKSFFKNLEKNDFVLMFFACHGKSLKPNHLSLVMTDTEKDDLAGTALDITVVVNYLAQKEISRYALFLDCCRSGAALKALGFGVRGEERTQVDLTEMAGFGKWILASCQSHEVAHEEKLLGHGVFSHYLLKGIREGEAVATEVEFVDVYSLGVYASTQINEFYAEIGQEPVFSGGDLKGFPLPIARNPVFKPGPYAILKAAFMGVFSVEDLSSKEQFVLGQERRFREFAALISPDTRDWERLLRLHGLALVIETDTVQAEIDAIRAQRSFEQPVRDIESDIPFGLQESISSVQNNGYALFVSASSSEMAYAKAETGSVFGQYVMEGLSGRAADPDGFVTVSSLFDYVQKGIRTETWSVSQTPLLYSQGEMASLPITHGTRRIRSPGRRSALMVATDAYRSEQIGSIPHNEMMVRRVGDVLNQSGDFDVNYILGMQVTRENILGAIDEVAGNSQPNDPFLFYFAGHGSITREQDYVLLMADSDPKEPFTGFSTRDLRQIVRSLRGPRLLFLDSSYAGTLHLEWM